MIVRFMYMRRLLKNLLLTCLIFLFCAIPVQADETKSPLRIGVLALAPYGYQDDSGRWRGNFYELAHAILERGNFEGYVEVVPILRVMQPGLLDCSFSIQHAAMDAEFSRVAFLGQSLKTGILPSQGHSLMSYDDLKGLMIAVPIGARMGEPFDSDETLQKVEVRNYEIATKMLLRGRVDAAMGVISSLTFNARKIGGQDVRFGTPLIINNAPLFLYCRHSSPTRPMWGNMKKTVDDLIADDVVEQIFGRYK